MRRFEKGGRFWEVLLEGGTVTTRSGTLTGKPRSSSERFAGAKAALAEIDKRVAKRMAEGGWVEVLPPFQGRVDLTPRVDGIDPVLAARWVRRPGTLAVDADAAAAAVERGLALGRDRLLAGLDDPLADRGAADTVRRILADGPGAVGPAVDDHAVLLALAPEAETADLLVGRFGVVAAVDAVAAGPRYTVVRDLQSARLQLGGPAVAKVRPAVARLRDLLVAATDADHAACEARARGALGRSKWRDLELCTLFPGAEWVDAWVVGAGLTGETLQVCGALSPAAFVKLVRGRKPSRDATPERLLPYLEIVLQRYGLDATPAVRVLAGLLGGEGVALQGRVRTTETVDALLEQLGHAALGSAARAALIATSDLTLATIASRGRPTKAAEELARELVRQPGLVPALLPHLDAAAVRRVTAWGGQEEALPIADDVPAVLGPGPGRPLAPWIRVPSLPPLRTPDGTRAWPGSACVRALEQLSADGDVEVVADALADVCDPKSLDALLAEVLRAWSEHAAPAIYAQSPWKRLVTEEGEDEDGRESQRVRWVRDRKAPETIDRPWILRAVQASGGEACGKALHACILAWGKRSGRYPELVADAVQVLARLPGEGVLVQLGEIARRVPKAKVRVEMQLGQTARDRGANPRHVDELLLPTLGLDPRGRVELDFGPRRFVGAFDPALEPVLTGPDGRQLRTLPKASHADDAAKAKAAHDVWRDLKQQVRSLRTTLLARLEDALRTQRPWTRDVFDRQLARHPLARSPVGALIWAAGDRRFRVDESGDPVDIDDQPIAIDGPVRLVHPVELPADERDAWKRVLVDYKLVQPFPQLDREVLGHAPIAAARGKEVARGRLFALRNRGWTWKYASGEGGPRLAALVLELQGVRVTVTAEEPVEVKGDETLTIAHVALFAGTWDAIPPVVLAEVARDLSRAVAEGE
jgi:hypothetical protein